MYKNNNEGKFKKLKNDNNNLPNFNDYIKIL
jgi:hypothetical protein